MLKKNFHIRKPPNFFKLDEIWVRFDNNARYIFRVFLWVLWRIFPKLGHNAQCLLSIPISQKSLVCYFTDEIKQALQYNSCVCLYI